MTADLFNYVRPLSAPHPSEAFDGTLYSSIKDHTRLRGQLVRVHELMQDGRYRTLEQIAAHAHGTEASISARLRDLRKDKYGKHNVVRRRKEDTSGRNLGIRSATE